MPSQENTLQSYNLPFKSSLGQDSHQSWSLSLQKWNCTYFRNRNYAGFCEPFFPISDLWICGMTPATRITTWNRFIQSIIFTKYWTWCTVDCTSLVRKGMYNKLWFKGLSTTHTFNCNPKSYSHNSIFRHPEKPNLEVLCALKTDKKPRPITYQC
jgi:hypothetical protein